MVLKSLKQRGIPPLTSEGRQGFNTTAFEYLLEVRMSDEEQSQGFRVNDRRRFDAEGNERAQEKGSEPAPAKPAVAKGPAAAAGGAKQQPQQPQPAQAAADNNAAKSSAQADRNSTPSAIVSPSGSSATAGGAGRAASSSEHSALAEPVGAPGEGSDDEGEINFSSFVVSLATQALMQLGEMPPPPGVELPVDPAGAKQTIDILAMLQSKTKGNLDGNEERLLNEILHNLKLSYVRRTMR